MLEPSRPTHPAVELKAPQTRSGASYRSLLLVARNAVGLGSEVKELIKAHRDPTYTEDSVKKAWIAVAENSSQFDALATSYDRHGISFTEILSEVLGEGKIEDRLSALKILCMHGQHNRVVREFLLPSFENICLSGVNTESFDLSCQILKELNLDQIDELIGCISEYQLSNPLIMSGLCHGFIKSKRVEVALGIVDRCKILQPDAEILSEEAQALLILAHAAFAGYLYEHPKQFKSREDLRKSLVDAYSMAHGQTPLVSLGALLSHYDPELALQHFGKKLSAYPDTADNLRAKVVVAHQFVRLALESSGGVNHFVKIIRDQNPYIIALWCKKLVEDDSEESNHALSRLVSSELKNYLDPVIFGALLVLSRHVNLTDIFERVVCCEFPSGALPRAIRRVSNLEFGVFQPENNRLILSADLLRSDTIFVDALSPMLVRQLVVSADSSHSTTRHNAADLLDIAIDLDRSKVVALMSQEVANTGGSYRHSHSRYYTSGIIKKIAGLTLPPEHFGDSDKPFSLNTKI